METSLEKLRDHFIRWQCLIRQHAVRQHNGQPSEGMQPIVSIDDETIARITVLLNPSELDEIIKEFQFMYKKTQDPAERRHNILRVLAAGYFQQTNEFSDTLTALFGPGSELAARMLDARNIHLYFQQYNQQYRIPCRVKAIGLDDPEYQITYWHNSLFNPNIPAGVRILAFVPDWENATAEPPIE